MVRKKKPLRIGLAIVPLFLLAALLLAGVGLAREGEKPTINEEYKVTINEVGDGRVVDTMKYGKDDYTAIKKVEKKNRGFLTRRFKTDDNTGELVDFKTDMDDSSHSVVINYDKPGFAYNSKGVFAVYGMTEKPKDNKGKTFTFEEKSTINSEFTLFTDQVILTKTIIELPEAASNPRYDAEEKAILYDMPPAATQLGFFNENKALLSVVFGLLTLAFAGALAFVTTRKPTVEHEAAGTPVTGGPSLAAAAPPEQPEARAPVKETPGFCRKCGAPMAEGKTFCIKCGAHV